MLSLLVVVQQEWKPHVQQAEGSNVFVLKGHLGGSSLYFRSSETRMKDFLKYLEARAARLKQSLYLPEHRCNC